MMTNNPERNRWAISRLCWKPASAIEDAAERYDQISLFKSDRAKLVYFFAAMIVLSIPLAYFAGDKISFDLTDAIANTILYIFLAIFILLGHKWAMGIATSVYILDKIFMMGTQPAAQIIFALICWQLGSTAIRVELARKRRAKTLATDDRKAA